MKRLLHGLALIFFACGLAACGPQRQSVFPPSLSIQQMKVEPDGAWQLTVRIQNNSYVGMKYQSVEGQFQVAQGVPARVHASFDLDIPSFAGDVEQIEILPTPSMTEALKAVAAKGSAGSMAYTLDGIVHCTPNLDDRPDDKDPRDFPFHKDDFLSPVPGIANTFR